MTDTLKSISTSCGTVSFIESGEGPTLVFLHGIGSGAASWSAQIEAFSPRYRVVAWNAPGYGNSEPVRPEKPDATDYSMHLKALLDALEIPDCHLVGHSLGAIMAVGFTRLYMDRVASLMLASPASGYGPASAEIQKQRRVGRMSLMKDLGPEGLARERHKNLLSENAPQWARDRVQEIMSQLRPEGYGQAVELLVNGDIKVDAEKILLPVTVVVGGSDTVTPPEGCKAVAKSFASSSFELLPFLGHACYVEGPEMFNLVLEAHLEKYR
jgi:pimeloyl-ACP methyl ester carboxylesterase